MPEAFIYDHVRTPRGRGKPDGSLHTVPTLQLATAALKAIKDRNGLKPNERSIWRARRSAPSRAAIISTPRSSTTW